MLTYQTAGESHGKGIAAFIDGFPSGVFIDSDYINGELKRRQGGYGRGGRQTIETDSVDVQTGIINGQSIGSPILLWIRNRDYKIDQMPKIEQPRPGHGDLTGSLKYLTEIRPILERSSARETAGRVAAGALAALLLREFKIQTVAYVLSIGSCFLNSFQNNDYKNENSFINPIKAETGNDSFIDSLSLEEIRKRRDQSEVYSLFSERDNEVKFLIDQCRESGDTLGGIVEIRVFNVPFGLGTHLQWDRKLDGRLAQAIMAVQAIKGVEIGLGFGAARRFGSAVHDPIEFDETKRHSRSFGFQRPTNNAGGIEAGMTNSNAIVLRAAMKPIATLKKALASVNLRTKESVSASYERSDVCAVSATSVVLENIVAFEIAAALIEKFGGDSLNEMKARFDLFHQMVSEQLA